MNERIVIHPPKKDSKGNYYVTVSYYFNGIRKQKRKSGFALSKEAKKAGEAIKKKLEENMPVIKANGTSSTTLREFAEEFMAIKKSEWSCNTMKSRKVSLSHCDFIDKQLTQIHKMDIAKNVKRLEPLYKFNTISSALGGWKVFLNAAVEYNYIVSAPTYRFMQQEEDSESVVENVMSIESATSLLERLNNRKIYLLTLIALTTGARGGEAVDMNANDINFATGIWKIHHQYKLTDKGFMRNQKLKTKNSYRDVPLPPSTIQAIKDYPFRTIDGYLFTGSPAYLKIITNKEYKKLGYDITLHGFRHTYITNLIRSKKFDLQSISRLAGDTIDTITETYAHYLEEMQEENIEKIKSLFG